MQSLKIIQSQEHMTLYTVLFNTIIVVFIMSTFLLISYIYRRVETPYIFKATGQNVDVLCLQVKAIHINNLFGPKRPQDRLLH